MVHVLAIVGGALLCGLTALLVALAVTGLQWLVQRLGGLDATRLLQGLWLATISELLSKGLPLLWPALAPWRVLVFGACFGLVGAAMRPGMVSRRRATTSTGDARSAT